MQLTAGEEPSAQLSARDHDGGVADWWSLDHGPLDRGEAANPFTPTDVRRRFRGLPGRMRYPGAPEPGWFSLEDPDQTVIGHMPDPSHVASLFFLDVISGHGTDWYLARLPTPPGHVLTVRDLRVARLVRRRLEARRVAGEGGRLDDAVPHQGPRRP